MSDYTSPVVSDESINKLCLEISESARNTTEDIFNTVPIVVNEMFPNLAEMPSTIYNYASLFQESKLMANAAIMDCVLLLPLDTLIEYSEKS